MTDVPASGPAFPHLLAPLTIKNTKLRNRAVVTAHGASDLFRDPSLNPDTYIEYLRRRAGGGVGTIIAQPLLANPQASIPGPIVERHARLVEAVKREGATLLIQLVNLGAYGRTEGVIGRPPSWSFDGQQSDAGESSHMMSDDEVERMIEAYRSAARMFADAGFDGVEVHGGHGYLIQQSLTPQTNQRTDRWGVDRTLFARTALKVVREEIGEHRLLCYRTSTDDQIMPAEGGRGPEGIAEDLTAILGTGLVDVLNTTMGDGGKSYTRSIPGYRHPQAPNIDLIANLRKLIDIDVPVIATGGIMSPAVADSVLRSGVCDLVAMTRAHIADPDVISKAGAGRTDHIRPCVRANLCVDRKQALYPEMSCFHNPEVLREVTFAPSPARKSRRILVVGAGPAGLKAAAVAATRGHHVDLIEAGGELGGRLRLTQHTAARELFRSVDHLVAELARLRVETHLGVVADEDVVRVFHPDEVIVATGARAHVPVALRGLRQRVITSDEALVSTVEGAVVVYDEIGTVEAALVAETLSGRGCLVWFATKFETVIPIAGQMQRWEVPDLLYASLEGVHVGVTPRSYDSETVELIRAGAGTTLRIPATTVVTVAPAASRTELVPLLARLDIAHSVVGDANAPRTAWQAFNEGHLAGLAV
jgi:2,4-dienoyl-CoA reductase-like NADH-dependent reductase (Old Yellow Enzyme family)